MGTVSDDPNVRQKTLEVALNDTRDQLATTLGELRGVMGESLDWRAWVRSHPWPSLAVVAVIGLRLGRGRWF